ncbi:MAG: NAD+ synthase [Bacteroidetes bacterium]|nr:NAD+ synthase [Bacteroidota bacterium]
MKIALAQQNYNIGDFEGNLVKIKEAIQTAKEDGVDLIVFPELAICGYPPTDRLYFKHFIDHCDNSITELTEISQDIGIIIGAPTERNKVKGQEDIKGKPLYNSAYFISDGSVQNIIHKTLLPTYDIFDEARYFEANSNFEIINFKNKKIALTICEDMWSVIEPYMLYGVSPLEQLVKENPELIINISASPFDYEHANERLEMLKVNANTYKLPIFYVNNVGAQTDIVFDGGSVVVQSDAVIYDQMDYFKEGLRNYDLDDVIAGGNKEDRVNELQKDPSIIPKIREALVLGIRDYFLKTGFKKAIIGLSGGMDSSLTAVLANEALGNENILALILPSEYTSEDSINDANELAKNLGIKILAPSIKELVSNFSNVLDPFFKDKSADVTEQNIQSRIRSLLLMAFSNKFGHILLNTSNKSEIATGYGTLYGDLSGGLAVLGDVYKTQIYEIAKDMNAGKNFIPESVFTKAPTAELSPGQKDSDDLPEYEILDQILLQYIEKHRGVEEIIQMGFDKSVVNDVIKRINTNEHKRYQTPPIIRISPKAFGIGRRMPIVGKY